MSKVDAIKRKREERVAEFIRIGLKQDHGGNGVAGSIVLYPADAARILYMFEQQRKIIAALEKQVDALREAIVAIRSLSETE